MPDISVILPVYNGLPYLQESVNSVLSQVDSDFELLILDDCSTDGSYEYLSSVNDTRIQLHRNDTNKGLFYNLNFLISKTSSGLVKLWSQDDVMHVNALKEIVAFHKKNPELGFSYTAVEYIDENGKRTKKVKDDPTPEIINQETHAHICFYCGSIAGNISNVTIKKEALQKVGLFNESMIISGDFDMWVRIAEFYNIGFIKQPLIILRDHSGQLSRQGKYYIRHIEEDAIAYKKLFSYLPDTLKYQGKKELRKYKLVFYYTLMVHAFLNGDIFDGAKFWKAIGRIDNPMVMLFYFIKNKFISKPKEQGYLKM